MGQMKLTRRSDGAPSTSEAYCTILRYIHGMNAREGTRLPPQNELVQDLGICATTLDAAMKWLIEDGVLNRKRRIGTYVIRPYPKNAKHSIWRVGIVMPPVTRSYFGAIMAQCLHKHFSNIGISDRTYMLSPSAAHGAEVMKRSLGDFSGLEEDVEHGLLDAIATSTRLVSDILPICGICNWERAVFGVQIDYPNFIEESTKLLCHRGCKRITYILPNDPCEWGQPQMSNALERCAGALASNGIEFESLVCSASGNTGLLFEHQFVERILALPGEQRPDGIIVQDDISAQSIAAMLSATEYRPLFIYQANQQLPLSYAIPAVPFSVDLDRLAFWSAELLLEKLLSPGSIGRTIYVKLKREKETLPRPLILKDTHFA